MSLSPRQKADIENRKKISEDAKVNQLKAKLAAKKSQTNTNDIVKNQTSVIQSKLGSKGLSAATLKMQQDLADKFNIVLFDVDGNISTVPISGQINPDINVGTGRFTSNAFKKSVEVLTGQVETSSGGGNLFNDYIAKPIEDFIDSIFTNFEFDALPQDMKDKVLAIDEKIKNEEITIETLRTSYNVNRYRAPKSRDDNLAKASLLESINLQIDAATERINKLKKEREQVFKQFKANTTLRDEVKRLTDEMIKLSKASPLTAELKANMDELIQKGSAVIEKMYLEGLEVNHESVGDLQNAMLQLSYRIKEPIQENKSILENGLGFINEQLFGFGAALAEIFEKIMNPEVDDMKNQLIKFSMAQKLAVLELASQ